MVTHKPTGGRWAALLVLILACSAAPARAGGPAAQPKGPGPAAVQADSTVDSLGRSTPLGTVQGFLSAARRRDDHLAARYLNTTLTGGDAALLARQLFVVLNRRMPARLNEISNSPEGSISDSLPLNQELVGSIAAREQKLDILLERVERQEGPIWLFSAETVAAIPDVYAEVSAASRPEQFLPQFLVRTRLASVPLFAWLFAAAGLPVLYLLTAVPVKLLGRLGARWHPRFREGLPAAAGVAQKPLRLLVMAIAVRWLGSSFGFSLRARQFWVDTSDVITIGAVVWLLIVLNARAEEYIEWRLRSQNLTGTASVLRVGRRVVDGIIIVAGGLVALDYFGVNLTAAVAGLGVGGIAVALAAQKTLENVIAGISLILDQAVRVGDYLKVGEFQGTVDAIGLRSTRIRTQDRTIVSVPNGQIANMSLETTSLRDKFWFHPLVRLRCDTSIAQIRCVVDGVRALLGQDPAVEPDSVRVRFLGFGSTSLDVDVFAYVLASDWSDFLRIQESLLFRTMEIVQEAGTAIAIPSQITYIAGAGAGAADTSGPAARGGVAGLV